MTASTSRAVLRVVLRAAAAVAVGTGASVLGRGSRAIPEGGPTTASVDSVLRFYAAWWAGAGLVLWRIAPDTAHHDAATRWALGMTALGAGGRLLAMRQSGLPHPLFRVLTGVELVLVPAAMVLHRRVLGDSRARR